MRGMTGTRTGRDWGFNVVGYVTANLGLGVATRNTIGRLMERNERIRAIDVDPGGGRSKRDLQYAGLIAMSRETTLAVNVFHMNPPEILFHSAEWERYVDVSDSLNVCVPFWELPRLPPQWAETLAGMDLVLAPTIFIRDACRKALPDTRVVHYPQAVDMPAHVMPDRARWKIPKGPVAFLVAFDINSDIERKNPWGAMDAFARAFLGDEDVRLVVKLNPHATTELMREQIERLRARVAADARVLLIEESLAYTDVLSLYASCDVLVSLHRSEGLGLPQMEAMWLGKPVISTAWSGTMDFMDEDSACLVPFELIPVAATQPGYAPSAVGEGQVWADPDLDAAAEWMRRLALEPGLKEAKGAAALAGITAHRLFARAHDPFVELEREWRLALAEMSSDRPSATAFRRALRRARLRRAPDRAKRFVVLTLRRLHLYPQGD